MQVQQHQHVQKAKIVYDGPTNSKRGAVAFFGLVQVVLGIVALALDLRIQDVDIHITLAALSIACGLFGILGAATMSGSLLRIFEFFCWGLTLYGVIVVIVQTVVYEYTVREFAWDIVLTCIAAVAGGFAHDLQHYYFLHLAQPAVVVADNAYGAQPAVAQHAIAMPAQHHAAPVVVA